MDSIARFNQQRWEGLAQANILYSRPWLNLTLETARERVDEQGILGPVAGKRVLCLAGGGGQQSAAFGLLGATVSVIDITETQLQRDREAAAHYGLNVETIQGDMRDLSSFPAQCFDVVWNAHSINFIPDVRPVFKEAARILRPGGLFRTHFVNPFLAGIEKEQWNGKCYPLWRAYIDGEEIIYSDENWDVWYPDGSVRKVPGPREFRHTLGTMVNGLVQNGFIILGIWEELTSDPTAEPGTWEHQMLIAPPWLTIWARLQPDVFG